MPQNTDQRPRSIYQQNLGRLLFFGIKFLCTNGHSKVIKGLPENAVNHDLYRGKNVSCIFINRCTKGAVRAVFDRLEKRMGTYEFTSVFENILTDRGSEFGNPEKLETGITGIQRSSIYYCDPMRSGQKGTIEQAHTMLRMILPKGTSFEFLTQWDVNLIVNHINSTPRESLDGKTPYDAALETLGEDVLKTFQFKPISPDEVNLTPKLIRFKK